MTCGPASPARLVVIGASVGAVEALGVILPEFPASWPHPVIVVVHLPRRNDSLLPSIFGARCALPVKEAEDKEPLCAGTIYFAPPDYHLLVNPDLTLALSSDEPVHFSRPSVDVLFESAADVFGDAVTGVILTGANDDGAAGLAAISAGGGTCVVQDPATATGRPMPDAALSTCPDATVLDLPAIARFLTTGSLP